MTCFVESLHVPVLNIPHYKEEEANLPLACLGLPSVVFAIHGFYLRLTKNDRTNIKYVKKHSVHYNDVLVYVMDKGGGSL